MTMKFQKAKVTVTLKINVILDATWSDETATKTVFDQAIGSANQIVRKLVESERRIQVGKDDITVEAVILNEERL